MAIFDTADTDLLARLHSGLFETPMWHGFLERLRERTHADSCALFFRHGDEPIVDSTLFYSGSFLNDAAQALYREMFHGLDPIDYDRLRHGRVYSLPEFMLPGNEAHARFQREYLEPIGVHYYRVMRVAGGNGYNAWLTLAARTRDFGAFAAALLSSLAPHIAIALGTLEQVERERTRFQTVAEAFHRMGCGWVTLDGRGQIVDFDAGAERLLEGVNGRKTQIGERLQLREPEAERWLADSLAGFARNPGGGPRALRLRDDPGISILLRPMAARPLSGARRPTLIAYLRRDDSADTERTQVLTDLFELTRSEARLAFRLAHGRSLAQAAAELGLTIETARNYSKRIFSKTGVRGQPDLVRIILESVATLV